MSKCHIVGNLMHWHIFILFYSGFIEMLIRVSCRMYPFDNCFYNVLISVCYPIYLRLLRYNSNQSELALHCTTLIYDSLKMIIDVS